MPDYVPSVHYTPHTQKKALQRISFLYVTQIMDDNEN